MGAPQADALLELAARVEAATARDESIDADIAAALGWVNFDNPTHAGGLIDMWTSPEGVGQRWHIPAYTASLDAAMTLALPNWWWNASAPLSEAAYGYSREDQRMPRAGFEMIGPPYSVGARAATVPLAICAAALRARAHTLQEEGKP